MSTITITRKIELRFNSDIKENKDAFYSDFKRWRKICQKAYNIMSTHLYFFLQREDFMYMSEAGQRRLLDENIFKDMTAEQKEKFLKSQNKEIYKIISDDQAELFTSSMQNAFYQMLSQRFLGECPSGILSSVCQNLFKTFKAERMDLIKGVKSLRNYKEDLPVPIPGRLLLHVKHAIWKDEVTKNFAFTLFSHPLRTNFGLDLSNNAYLLGEAFSSFFLPLWARDAEVFLSDSIIAAIAAAKSKNEVTINDRLYKIEMSKNDDYWMVETIDDEKTIAFKMIKQKFTLKDGKGESLTDDKGKKVKGERYIITNNIKLCDSSIKMEKAQIEDKDGRKKNITKLFLNAVLEMEKKEVMLDESKIAYVRLSPETPLQLQVGEKIFPIGSKDDFLYRRLGIQGAYRQVQRDLRFEGGGRGQKRKMKGIERYKNYEKDVVKNKIHNYTRKLIDYCLEFKCKYIYLLGTKRTKEEAKENPFIMRNYSVGSFSRYIEEKASRVNIIVVEEKENEEVAGDPD